MSDKYAAITAQRGRFPVRLMCAALAVSVGGFYAAAARLRGAPRARIAADARHGDPIAPNRLQRDLSVRAQTALDRVWVSDITYVPTRAGGLYLAVVLDLASRRVVGWAMSEGSTSRSRLCHRSPRRRGVPTTD
jgi:transposase InsO family protein